LARYFNDHGYQAPYDVDKTRIPLNVLANRSIDDFLALCERVHGPVITSQARALLVERAFCEEQNYNALTCIKGLAVDLDEWDLALALGVYFDKLSY